MNRASDRQCAVAGAIGSRAPSRTFHVSTYVARKSAAIDDACFQAFFVDQGWHRRCL